MSCVCQFAIEVARGHLPPSTVTAFGPSLYPVQPFQSHIFLVISSVSPQNGETLSSLGFKIPFAQASAPALIVAMSRNATIHPVRARMQGMRAWCMFCMLHYGRGVSLHQRLSNNRDLFLPGVGSVVLR